MRLPSGRPIKRTVRVGIVAVVVAIVAFVPLPYPSTAQDRQDAVAEALAALLDGRVVDTPDGPQSFDERTFLTAKAGRIYFVNEAGVPDSLFTSVGLKPLPNGYKINLDGGDGLVRCGYTGPSGERTWHLRFSYSFGSVGGIGYIVRIKRSILGRQIRFVFEWIA